MVKNEITAESYPQAAALSMPRAPAGRGGLFYTNSRALRLSAKNELYWTLTHAAVGFKMAPPMSDMLGEGL